MDIRIGVIDNPREITMQLADDADRAALKTDIDAALAGDSTTLWLTDDKGREIAVAAAKIAFVEIGPEGSNKPIGFG